MLCQSCSAYNEDEREYCFRCQNKLLVLSGVKVVGVPESSWIIVGALIAGALALGARLLTERVARRPLSVRAGD